MKRIGTLVLAAASLFGTQAHACLPEEIRVEIVPFAVQHDYGKSLFELQRMGIEGLVGAVVAERVHDVKGCTATVGWANARLFVASELRRNPCSFEHVLRHEEGHVAIYNQALQTLEDRVRNLALTMPLAVAAEKAVLEVRQEHKRHDANVSEENSQACGGWMVARNRFRFSADSHR